VIAAGRPWTSTLPHARGPLGVVAVALALAFPPSAGAATDLHIAPQGSPEQTVSADELGIDPDVREREYTLPDGTRATITGVSIDELLRRVGVDPYGYTRFEVSDGDATIVLERDELLDDGAFPEGRPVLFVDDQGTHFLRPAGAAGARDARLLTLASGTLTFSLGRQGSLSVRARASRTRIEPGQQVSFAATVTGATAGERVSVSWTFDRDGRADGRQVTHRFARPGTYKVVVGATSARNPTGASAVVTVQVGEERSGPDRTGGGTDPDASAPDGGAASGSTTGPDGEAGQPAPAGRREPRESSRPRASVSDDTAGPRRRTRPSDAPGTETSEPVEGTLLSDAAPMPQAALADALRAARTGKPKQPEDGAGALPPAIWGGLAAFALLGLGAWRERRGLPRRAATG
jgi:hypothetical protein